MSFEPTKEEREAWRGRNLHKCGILADFALRLLAALMETEWWINHDRIDCCECDEHHCDRHNWDSARWLEAARKRLEEK